MAVFIIENLGKTLKNQAHRHWIPDIQKAGFQDDKSDIVF